MDYHQNARLTIHSREQLVRRVLDKGCTLKLAAASFNLSAKTAARMRAPLSDPGILRAQGPQFEAASLAPADILRLIRKAFVFTPPAHARLSDRAQDRAEHGHRRRTGQDQGSWLGYCSRNR
jgi:leucine-zipper of insertion element IS481